MVTVSVTTKIVPVKSENVKPAIFSGYVIGNNLLGKTIVIFINHKQQLASTVVIEDTSTQNSYKIEIPMTGIPKGSTVIFKINGKIYGSSILVSGTSQILLLQIDQQGHE
jgi:hypothetical protein